MNKNARFFLYAAVFIVPLLVFGQGIHDEPILSPDPIEEDHFFRDFVNMLTTLGLIVATIFFISWFLKRMVNTRIEQANTASIIKIVERRALSPKSALYVVEVYNKQILVGETSSGIKTLAEFPIDHEIANP